MSSADVKVTAVSMSLSCISRITTGASMLTAAGAVSLYHFIPLEVDPVQFQLGVMYEQHVSVN